MRASVSRVPVMVRFGVGLPQWGGPEQLANFARRAEELGFARLWTLDAVVGGATSHTPVLDGMHALTYAAAVTERTGLGIAVIVLPRRVPALLAREIATLDRLTGGRLIVGFGVGYDDEETAAGLGLPSGRRVRRFTEGIAVMRALWTQEEASYAGELFRFSGVRMGTKPVQRPHPPLWIGASHPDALRRAARLGDGWLGAGSTGTEAFLEQAPIVAAAAPEGFPLGKRVYIAVEDTEERARAALTPLLDGLYGREGLTQKVAVCGPVERCAHELRRLIEAGATELLLHPLHDPLDQLEALADVAAALKA
jgi:probable F420-dependent oxidoreductase